MKLKPHIFNIANNILLLALLCVITGQLYVTFVQYEDKFIHPVNYTKQNYGNDFITQYAKRYTEVKKMFTKSSILSYIGEENENFAGGFFHYVLTQYNLAPSLIYKDNTIHDTIIYNLYNSKQINPSTNFHLNHGWQVLKDFNNGIIILAK